MKTLCFVLPGKALLPEVQAYREYFSTRYQVFVRHDTADVAQFDIVWFFMGLPFYRRRAGQFIVHEFTSLSTPPYARLKDNIKRYLLPKPSLRVFQNEVQAQILNFNDGTPHLFRDMGVSANFMQTPGERKSIDLIYAGSMARSRQLDRALDKIVALKPDIRLDLYGIPESYLQKRYAAYANIAFRGPVDYNDIPGLLRKACFGLNYVPDCYPYNLQTSTKLLEYAACGLPVIGNKTAWVDSFLAQHPMPYFDLNVLAIWPLTTENSSVNQLCSSWLWQQRIANAGFETILPN